ncbi:hypothetical protein ACHAWU_006128 [Discostella pseudostelligera]|uniref:Uncharacterized protein n=1 Tax=Discostella pseudostelligera TaxID=259834 RepID=A0ABD3M195_9STRA
MNMVSPSTSAIIGCIFLFTILVIRNIISRSRLSSSEFYPGINAISSKSTVSIEGQNEVMNDTQRNNHYRFIPFPYNTLGSGADMQCQWETKDMPNPNTYDMIQLTAYREGEARECLSSRRVVVSGDSYTKQLFVAMADILVGELLNDDEEILISTQRSQFVEMAQQLLASEHEKEPSFPVIEYRCEAECYGKKSSFSKICSDCMNSYTLDDDNFVAVVGAGVHILEGNTLNFTIREINKFLSLSTRTIFMSTPSSDPTNSSRRDGLYESLLPNLAPRNPQHPFLDVHQLTRSCVMKNCSFDGGHGWILLRRSMEGSATAQYTMRVHWSAYDLQ